MGRKMEWKKGNKSEKNSYSSDNSLNNRYSSLVNRNNW
jgi:hypothetical protein